MTLCLNHHESSRVDCPVLLNRIIGFRSGSSLLESILAGHPNVATLAHNDFIQTELQNFDVALKEYTLRSGLGSEQGLESYFDDDDMNQIIEHHGRLILKKIIDHIKRERNVATVRNVVIRIESDYRNVGTQSSSYCTMVPIEAYQHHSYHLL
jgi:hypothetical protein